MCGGTPSAPTPPPRVPEAPRAPDVSQGDSVQERDRRRRAQASGQAQSTILTGPRGTQGNAATATKTLLGE